MRGGILNQSARFPDFTCCNFFLQEYLKAEVLKQYPRALVELKAAKRGEIVTIRPWPFEKSYTELANSYILVHTDIRPQIRRNSLLPLSLVIVLNYSFSDFSASPKFSIQTFNGGHSAPLSYRFHNNGKKICVFWSDHLRSNLLKL